MHRISRFTIVAGDPIIRSDEELAFSVLRYGKILSRKVENRMQVSRRQNRPPIRSVMHVFCID
jgi:hypothetical protein